MQNISRELVALDKSFKSETDGRDLWIKIAKILEDTLWRSIS